MVLGVVSGVHRYGHAGLTTHGDVMSKWVGDCRTYIQFFSEYIYSTIDKVHTNMRLDVSICKLRRCMLLWDLLCFMSYDIRTTTYAKSNAAIAEGFTEIGKTFEGSHDA